MIKLSFGYAKYLLMRVYIIALYAIKIFRATHVLRHADSACHKNNIKENSSLLNIDNKISKKKISEKINVN